MTSIRHSFKKRHKYGAKKTEVDGINFDSILEAKYYLKLKAMRDKTNEVVFFIRQPTFDLPGGTKYRADFLVFWTDGTASVVDVKGVETSEFILKKKQVESLYPVEIKVLKNF